MKKSDRIKVVFFSYSFFLILSLIAINFLINGNLELRCIFRDVTSLRCPGCGNTNALLTLISGNFLSPMEFNLMFYPELIIILFVLIYIPFIFITQEQMPRHISIVIIIAFILFVLWGIIRNILNI